LQTISIVNNTFLCNFAGNSGGAISIVTTLADVVRSVSLLFFQNNSALGNGGNDVYDEFVHLTLC
jgi:hypothetical protein